MKKVLLFFKEFEKDVAFYNHNTEILLAWTIVFGSIVFVFLNTIDRGILVFVAGFFLSAVLLAAVSFMTIFYLHRVSMSPATSFLWRTHRFLNTSMRIRVYMQKMFKTILITVRALCTLILKQKLYPKLFNNI